LGNSCSDLKLDFGEHEFGVQRPYQIRRPVTTVLIGSTDAWCGFDHHKKRDKTKISDREKDCTGDEGTNWKTKTNPKPYYLMKLLVYLTLMFSCPVNTCQDFPC